MILTRSLSAAAGGLSTPKSSSDTSGDAWPWQRVDSRPSSSIPRSIPELSMVLVPEEEEEGGGPGGSGGGQEEDRRSSGSQRVCGRASRSPSSLYRDPQSPAHNGHDRITMREGATKPLASDFNRDYWR